MYDTDLSRPSSIAQRCPVQLVSRIRWRPDGVAHERRNAIAMRAAKN
jgi:hypothetical protein